MNRSLTIAFVSVIALSTMACQRTTYTRSYVSPLPASPISPIEGQTLSPITPGQPGSEGQILVDGQDANANSQVVSAPPAPNVNATGGSVGRTDLLGGWSVSSGGDNCKLFMTLTKWSGGYRANTRGCSDATLSQISAWNLNGNQVVLKDAGGGNVATLSGGGTNFSGQTANGAPINFAR
ncbi:Protease inhibitor Inh [Pseudovibrio denitrificans]|uniref:Protease inhibitor Inh n=1 Tax=Pseudovibrio denitrificans TaxID=258256 RepID=A0A1I7B388_9HYPH|nr:MULTISPECIES: AprI/Inh family metalloprotease inhibitor [Pseudovibrio]EEA95306.1 outer membrane lipoprotein Omp19 [Pseudovibrio sp. JE062]SFT81663.1 Protease inhibitor Inh [Pseudovibrio denitrificans]